MHTYHLYILSIYIVESIQHIWHLPWPRKNDQWDPSARCVFCFRSWTRVADGMLHWLAFLLAPSPLIEMSECWLKWWQSSRKMWFEKTVEKRSSGSNWTRLASGIGFFLPRHTPRHLSVHHFGHLPAFKLYWLWSRKLWEDLGQNLHRLRGSWVKSALGVLTHSRTGYIGPLSQNALVYSFATRKTWRLTYSLRSEPPRCAFSFYFDRLRLDQNRKNH